MIETLPTNIQHAVQIYSGITCGRVLKGELYTHRFQKLFYLRRRRRP